MILRVFPVIATFGPFTLYTYTLLIDLGIGAALGWLYLRAPADKRIVWFDAGLVAAVSGLVGARLVYAWVNGNYYADHLGEVLQIWLGGLAWPGAALGALAGLWLYCIRKREPLAPIVDVLALPAVWLSALGWGGCWAAGCAHGFEVIPGQWPGWLASASPDIYGVVAARWPTQAVGLVGSLMALAALHGARHAQWPAGARGLFALSLIAVGAFLLGFTRSDPIPRLNGLRLDVIGSAGMLLAATFVWSTLVTRRTRPSHPASVAS